jgi:hypothetical protein
VVLEERVGASSRVGVMRAGGEYRLVATRPVTPGKYLFTIVGELTRTPTRYTVQSDGMTHVDIPEEYEVEAVLDRFYWRFMNHSCDPTAVIRDRQVFSLKPIELGQEITFNYNTTEYEMAEPFSCRCGSSRCGGRVRGFRFLCDEERERLRPWLSDHLLSVLEGDVIEPKDHDVVQR